MLGFDKEKLKLDHVFGSIILGYLLCRYVFGATHDPMQVILGRHLGRGTNKWKKQTQQKEKEQKKEIKISFSGRIRESIDRILAIHFSKNKRHEYFFVLNKKNLSIYGPTIMSF